MGLPSGIGISFETFNDFVRVNIRADAKNHFEGALGLMGSFPNGDKVARDGKTIMTDMDAFGQEWQVRSSEEKLFHSLEGVQHPESCRMPTATELKSRRLGESSIDLNDAKRACAHVSNPQDFDACVFDVLATNDKDLAGSYWMFSINPPPKKKKRNRYLRLRLESVSCHETKKLRKIIISQLI